MKIKTIRIQSLFTTAMLCAAFTAAKADDSIASVTTTTTVTEPGIVTTTQTPGTVVYFRTAPQTLLKSTLEGRGRDLESKIDQAHNQGQLSNEQYEVMKRELRRIAQETTSDGIAYPVALMLAQDLDSIGQQYGTVITTQTNYVPIITGTRFTITTGQTFQLDDLSRRRADLETTISKDVLQGRLSASRAADLRAQLAGIGSEANVYLADGSFNAKESRRLYDAFDRVAEEIEKSAGKDKN